MSKLPQETPPTRFLQVIFRLSLLLNMILVPTLFMKEHIIYFFRHSHSHDWITQPIMNSSWYKAIYQVEHTKEEHILKLYQLMKDVHEVFEKNKLQYWIDSGTLLGAVRHQGIIPWDGDIDIGLRFEDGFRFQQLIPEFERLGYEVDEAYFGFKIYLIENKNDRLHNICCDIFMFAKDGDKYHYYSPESYKRWPGTLLEKELFPLKLYKFGDLQVWGPNKPEPYLTALYGNWQKIAYRQNEDHLAPGEKSSVPFTLTEKDLEPAQPTGPLKDRVGVGAKVQ